MLKNKSIHVILLILVTAMLPNMASAELKMGIVNLDALFKEIPIYRESQEKVKKQFDPRARNLKTLEQEWNSLNDQYLKNETVMSDKEKKDLVEKIQNVETKFRSGQEKIQADLQKVQQEELSRIRTIVEKAITEYAEKNDFDIIIRADGTTLYAKKYINITQDGSVDYQSSEVDCILNFRTPFDISENGWMDFGGVSAPTKAFSGLYQCIGVTSNFSGGKFEQTLALIRRRNQEQDIKAEASKSGNAVIKDGTKENRIDDFSALFGFDF